MGTRLGSRAAAAAALLMLAAAAATAQDVTLAGRMGDRALLVVDGRPHTLAVGAAAGNVRLLRWAGDVAEVQIGGQMQQLRVGGAPARMQAAASPAATREIVLTAGPGGHFTTLGAINGKPARFMVDTGATLVAMGRDEAQRLGLDLSGATVGMIQTANGATPILMVTLGSVRVGEVQVTNVGAAIVPQPMPYLLLGNSFLSRFQMQRHNDEMRLQLR
jgi:aspartyl protease family protein